MTNCNSSGLVVAVLWGVHAHGAEMTSIFVSCVTLLTLLAGDGLAVEVRTDSIDSAGDAVVPAIDVSAPRLWGTLDVIRRGGEAVRIELNDANMNDEVSAWYRLAFVDRGTRLRVFEDYATTTRGPESDIVDSENVAWRLANKVVGTDNGPAASDKPPSWARVRTGNDTGSSAGLMFTLAYIDLLTPGPLAGNLRVAGTGGIGPDGVVTPAFGLEVKVAAAMLTQPDVVFTTSPPTSIEHVTVVESEHTRLPTAGYTVGEWLNVNGYEQAGRIAASSPGTAAVVVVHDIRQATAWLCGRTGNTSVCSIAHRSATIPIRAQ